MNEKETQKIVEDTIKRLKVIVTIHNKGTYSAQLNVSLVLCSEVPFGEWEEVSTGTVSLSSLMQ
jgi:hypothetical protein